MPLPSWFKGSWKHTKDDIQPDPQTLQSLREASDDIEDRIEGVYEDLSA